MLFTAMFTVEMETIYHGLAELEMYSIISH